MKLLLSYVTFGYILAIVICAKALECGLSEGPDHETIRRIASQCTKNHGDDRFDNNNQNNNGDDSNSNNSNNSDESDSNESRETTSTTTTQSPRRQLRPRNGGGRGNSNNNNNNRNNNNSNNNNDKHQPSSSSGSNSSPSYNRGGSSSGGHNQYGSTNINGNNNYPRENKTQNCEVISCVLSQLHMTDKYGYPDRSMVSQALTKNVRNNELRDFLQESTDDCFEILDADQKRDQCEYSTHLINCLADKGRNNCDDWHDQNFPF